MEVIERPVAAAAAGDVVYAGFWRRFLALVLDQLLLGTVFYAMLFGLATIAALTGAFDALEGMDPDAPPAWLVVAYLGFSLLYLAAVGLYFSLMESSRHQATLGKLALGIKVVDEEGRRLGFGRALGRWAATALSYLTLYIGFVMAAFTRRKRALHDLVAGTLVVDRWAYTGQPERQRRELGGCLLATVLALAGLVLVAVLGIVAAIAIPAYQDYVQRARISVVTAETATLRGVIADFQAREGRCPVNGEGGIREPGAPGVLHATRITVGEFDEGGCGFELELGGTGSRRLDGGLMWWELQPASGNWICSSDLPDSTLPLECRG